jgi:hypothetical protein
MNNMPGANEMEKVDALRRQYQDDRNFTLKVELKKKSSPLTPSQKYFLEPNPRFDLPARWWKYPKEKPGGVVRHGNKFIDGHRILYCFTIFFQTMTRSTTTPIFWLQSTPTNGSSLRIQT